MTMQSKQDSSLIKSEHCDRWPKRLTRRERSWSLLKESQAQPKGRQSMVRPDGLEPPTLSFVG